MLRHGKMQQVRLVKGSTAFTRFVVDAGEPGTLHIAACNADCPQHYVLEIEITSPHIGALAVSGGGAIESSGAFPRQHALALAVSGGGAIDARTMESADVTASVRGGGLARVKADDTLTAAVQGGGRIQYWGNPAITEAVEGGGDVERGR